MLHIVHQQAEPVRIAEHGHRHAAAQHDDVRVFGQLLPRVRVRFRDRVRVRVRARARARVGARARVRVRGGAR